MSPRTGHHQEVPPWDPLDDDSATGDRIPVAPLEPDGRAVELRRGFAGATAPTAEVSVHQRCRPMLAQVDLASSCATPDPISRHLPRAPILHLSSGPRLGVDRSVATSVRQGSAASRGDCSHCSGSGSCDCEAGPRGSQRWTVNLPHLGGSAQEVPGGNAMRPSTRSTSR
jgi:hypothetical protein